MRDLPTGENVLPPLSEFEVTQTRYNLATKLAYGQYSIDVDIQAGRGFFSRVDNLVQGSFWLVDHLLVGFEGVLVLPRDVKLGLARACISL